LIKACAVFVALVALLAVSGFQDQAQCAVHAQAC